MLFGVVSFPGSNCEKESVRILKKVGIDAKIVRWNENKEVFDACDGFFLVGGFSYEDRSRSGVIAANDMVCEYLREYAQAGKPIIGICNGAQILVETGLVTDTKTASIALTFNVRVQNGVIQGTGYYHDWVYIKNTAPKGKSPFNNFDGVIKTPIAHGEGRFLIPDELLKEIKKNNQIVFQYCTATGDVKNEYPVNPNGSLEAIAGVCNKAGNVLALMPHPERAEEEDAITFFSGIKTWLETHNLTQSELQENSNETVITPLPPAEVQFFIESIITDNTQETVKTTLERRLSLSNLSLKRFRYFGIQMRQATLPDIESIILSDECANTNKETVYVLFEGVWYKYSKVSGLQRGASPLTSGRKTVIVQEKEDTLGQSKSLSLQHLGLSVTAVHAGIAWESDEAQVPSILSSLVIHNPVSSLVQSL